jgi:hypothetical protein
MSVSSTVFGVAIIGIGAFVLVGGVTGELADMLAAIFAPSMLQ